jgi:thioredoxin 1
MLERLVVSLVIIFISTGALFTVRRLHARRVGRIVTVGKVAVTGRPTLLYFRSDSCGPCYAQSRYLQALENKFDGRLNIQRIDADKERDKADHYGIFTLPTTLIVDPRGEVRHINYGLTATNKLAQQLEKVA